MPASATVTAFHTMIANTRAKASEQNTNFGTWRGHLLPIEPATVGASDNSHDLGSTDHRWRTAYFGEGPYVAGNRLDRAAFQTFTATTTAATAGGIYLGDATAASLYLILPYGSGATGTVTTVQKIDSTDNFVYVQGATNTALIDGATLSALARQYRSKSFLFDGTRYRTLSDSGPEHIKTSPTSYTAELTVGAGAVDLSIPVSFPCTGKRMEFVLAAQDTTGSITLRDVTTGGQVGVQFDLLCDGTSVANFAVRASANATDSTRLTLSSRAVSFSHSPNQGLHTYGIRATCNGNTGDGAQLTALFLTAREVNG